MPRYSRTAPLAVSQATVTNAIERAQGSPAWSQSLLQILDRRGSEHFSQAFVGRAQELGLLSKMQQLAEEHAEAHELIDYPSVLRLMARAQFDNGWAMRRVGLLFTLPDNNKTGRTFREIVRNLKLTAQVENICVIVESYSREQTWA